MSPESATLSKPKEHKPTLTARLNKLHHQQLLFSSSDVYSFPREIPGSELLAMVDSTTAKNAFIVNYVATMRGQRKLDFGNSAGERKLYARDEVVTYGLDFMEEGKEGQVSVNFEVVDLGSMHEPNYRTARFNNFLNISPARYDELKHKFRHGLDNYFAANTGSKT